MVESGGYSGIESLFILFWWYTNREGGLKHPECLIQNKTKPIIYICVMTFSKLKLLINSFLTIYNNSKNYLNNDV